MPFPLGEWIDTHEGCRYHLGSSGMWGSIRHPRPGPLRPGDDLPETLRRELANHLRVDAERVFLTHGATEANSWTLLYLRPRPGERRSGARLRFPEYPPLAETARWAGFRVTTDRGPARVAIVSRPRNPEGDLWSRATLDRWAAGASSLLVDETFREFARVPSVAVGGTPGVWATGSLTKFYAGDDIRVGWIVAPPEAAPDFARFHGNLADEVPAESVRLGLATVRAHGAIARAVDRLLRPNRAAWRRAFPRAAVPVGPVGFDRTEEDGDSLARRCLAASVLVSPGSFFGEPRGVRIGLTRRSFPRDLGRYLAVRDRPAATATNRAARPRPGARARARAGRA